MTDIIEPEEPEEPKFTDAELAAADAETAALRAQLRNMAGAAAPSIHQARVEQAVAKGIVHLEVKEDREIKPDPRVAAALADRQARLDAMPKHRIAKALVPQLNESWIQERHISDKAKPRDNDDRAVDCRISCSLAGMLSGSMTPADQALDAMINIMHFLRRDDMMDGADISELIDIAHHNFVTELNQEELNKINVVQTRSAPAWAWAGIDEALARAAEGWRFGDDHAAMGVQNSIVGMRVATDTPDITELVLDSRSGHPQFAEIEQPNNVDDVPGFLGDYLTDDTEGDG